MKDSVKSCEDFVAALLAVTVIVTGLVVLVAMGCGV